MTRPLRFFALLLCASLCCLGRAGAQSAHEVGTVSELQSFAADVSGGNSYEGQEVTLTADLDLTGVAWQPIGTATHPFRGTFRGQHHTLTGLKVSADALATGGTAGLFGMVGAGGKVLDVNLSGGNVAVATNGMGYTCSLGAVAGINAGTIVGCTVSGVSVSGSDWNARVGGLVGENQSGALVQCCLALKATAYSRESSKGIVGTLVGYNLGTVEHCLSSVSVQHASGSAAPCPLFGSGSGTQLACIYLGGQTSDVTQPKAVADGANCLDDISLWAAAGTPVNVLLEGRTLYADGSWNTLCLPFSVPAPTGVAEGSSPLPGAEVMTLVGSSYADGELTLQFKAASSIEAGYPYLVRWPSSLGTHLTDPVFLGVSVSVSDAEHKVTTPWANFVGNIAPLVITEADPTMLYLGGSNLLYYPDGPMQIGSCRAWFRLGGGLEAGPVAQGVRSFSLSFDDSDAAPASLPLIAPPASATAGEVWFTLTGRRLAGRPSAPGLYICGGRKVRL